MRSLSILEKVLGKEHRHTAASLNNLAILYEDQGNYSKAEPLYLQSLSISEKVLGKEHPLVATTMNNLAGIYEDQGNYSKAEPLYLQSLSIREKVLGKEHPQTASSLNNLAELYRLQGNYSKAEPLYLRSLSILEKVLGEEHPHTASTLNNLALLYRFQGNYSKAEPLYLQSLFIREKVLGKEHPQTATSLNNLVVFYWGKGDINRATDFLSRGLEIEEKNLQLIYAVGAEQRKQDYARTFRGRTYIAVSLALQESSKNPTLSKLAATTVLRRKGRVLDAMTDTVQTLRIQLANNPETKKTFDDWLDVQRRLANLVYRGQGKQKFEVYQKLIKELQAQKEDLEEKISVKSTEFRQEIKPLKLTDIQAKIPHNSAMVEIVQYSPLNPKVKTHSEQWGKSRYAAVVLRSSGEPSWVDLGDAGTINKSVADFREMLKSPFPLNSRGIGITPTDKARVSKFKEVARTLHNQVMAPVRPLLGDARHLLLSPDGQLNLIPFEALRDENNQYLVQHYSFSYLTTGRDLLRLDTKAKKISNPVVFADINYDNQYNHQENQSRGLENKRSVDFANLIFGSLAATSEEGNRIKEIFPNTNIIAGKQATETAIKQLQTPSILHLATHGFFLPDQKKPDVPTNTFNQQLNKPKPLNLE
ncbi:MAG: tetratricopeptide repeat protein, partial [Mastigocoleus sp.]